MSSEEHIVFIGDIHGNDIWKKVIEQEREASTYIFVGDYFDSWNIPGIIQMANFKDIINFKETTDKKVILLIGNHDYHYYPEIGDTGTSGFQAKLYFSIAQLINEYRHHLQIAYTVGDILCTHAGVSEEYYIAAFKKKPVMSTIAEDLNELFFHKPGYFKFNGYDPTGDNISQGPLWIRPRSLVISSRNIRKHYHQIVGHTIYPELNLESLKKWTGGKYFFIDTLNTSREYLVKKEGKFAVRTVHV